MPIAHDPEQAESAAIHSFLPSFRGRRVLEIGCGDGRLTKRYAPEASEVTAIDPDARAIADCRRAVRLPHVTFAAVGFEAFTAPAQRYDVAILSWSL